MIKKLTIAGGRVFAGNAADKFVPAQPFKFLRAEGHLHVAAERVPGGIELSRVQRGGRRGGEGLVGLVPRQVGRAHLHCGAAGVGDRDAQVPGVHAGLGVGHRGGIARPWVSKMSIELEDFVPTAAAPTAGCRRR